MGKPFGRYELLAKIAAGGMAEVFLAVQRGPAGFEKHVALKQLLPQLAEDSEFVELFLDEARIAATLSHPNICQIYELGLEGGRHYIAMEYLEGKSLARVLVKAHRTGQRLPPALGAYIVGAAAQGLAEAHEKTDASGKPLGIVHRDVSPQNLVVTYDGQVKVVDFGIAHAVHRRSHTRTGEVRGKISYMSPEQVESRPLDARSDVFSLGAVLYEVLTGHRVFDAGSDVLSMKAVLSTEVPRIEERGGIPKGMDAVVKGALTRALDRRTRSARELARAISATLRHLEPPPGPEPLAQYMRSLFREERAEERLRLEATSAGNVDEFFLTHPRVETSSAPARPRTVSVAAMPQAAETNGTLRGWAWAGGGFLAAAALGLAFWAGGTLRPRGQARPPAPEAALALPAAAAATPVAISPPPASTPVRPAEPAPDGARTAPAQEPTRKRAPAPARHGPKMVSRGEPRELRPGAAAGRGALTLDTYPWTDVYLNGQKLGTTPLVEVALPAGHLRLRAVNEAEKIDRSLEVDIVAHQTTSRRVTW